MKNVTKNLIYMSTAFLLLALLLLPVMSPLLHKTQKIPKEVFASTVTDPVEKKDSKAVKHFNLYATDGTLTLPDGTSVYVWGYSEKNEKGSATYPAPVLTVNEGDQVEVTFTNLGTAKKGIKRVAHTIHFHGLDTNQANDGVPHTSKDLLVGDQYTYQFVAKHAGTYFYHCHVDTVEHLQMGMTGAFIVKAKDGVNTAWTGGPAYNKEYTFMLNEIDPVWHKAVEEGKKYDRTSFHPTYFTMNGKAYPDTETDPTTMIEGKLGEKVLVRLINTGYQPHSMHLHGYHFEVIASDGRPLASALVKDTVNIGPGERYDLLITFDQDGTYPFHSHYIVDNTNNGAYPGGMHTMVQVTEEGKENSDGTRHHHNVSSVGSADLATNQISPEESSQIPVPDEIREGTTVVISHMSYSVKELKVKQGSTVTWINKDPIFHTVTSIDDKFDSRHIEPGKMFTYTFNEKGTFPYYCATHPSMEASVIVE
ncbi:multicopper oxidase domain-containing protein [Paenibacillus sp. Marseille-Q4541]|uniref:multicopper oxidase family protein n=1 Tax=Paenibacillus sp. Marseille-Q4541 TaxID=2831522 RepID=UPI001BAADCFD|nr:multicopper oxidase domain-containing protein [Paenibacillus sp. Marseille-Q4541]